MAAGGGGGGGGGGGCVPVESVELLQFPPLDTTHMPTKKVI